MSRGKDPIAAELGRRGGRKGGRARALSLTPEQRREIAQRAAAARWQRADDEASAAPESLAHMPTARERGAIEIEGRKLDAFVLADGRQLIGILSAALAVDHDPDQLTQRIDAAGEDVVTFRVPGDWRLMRGLTPATLVALCHLLIEAALTNRTERGARSRARQAARILAVAANGGLPGLIDAAVQPVGGSDAPMAAGAREVATID